MSEIKDKVILRAGESSSYISDDSDEENKTLLSAAQDDDDSAGFIPGRRGNARSYRQKGGGLTNAEKALKKGYAVSELARNAMVNLRG